MKFGVYSLFVGCLLLSQTAFAQPTQGSWLIGGTAGFNSSSQNDVSISVINISPMAGYFFTDNLAAGAQISFTSFGGDFAEGSNFGIGPFVRYYFNNAGSARFFGQGAIAYSIFDPGGNADSSSNFAWEIGPGVDFFLNEHVALELFLGFGQDKEEDAEESTTNIGFNIGVAAFLGGSGSN